MACRIDPRPKVRRAIKGFISDFPEYERLLPHIKGMIFTRISVKLV